MNNIKIYALSALLALLLSCRAAASDRRDGNWWLQQDEEAKLYYVTGMFDGVQFGHRFSQMKLILDKSSSETINNKDKKKCLVMTEISFEEYTGKYLEGVTSKQILDGLDDFYMDYRNRIITPQKAAWVVTNSIDGASSDEITSLIENLRRSAKE